MFEKRKVLGYVLREGWDGNGDDSGSGQVDPAAQELHNSILSLLQEAGELYEQIDPAHAELPKSDPLRSQYDTLNSKLLCALSPIEEFLSGLIKKARQETQEHLEVIFSTDYFFGYVYDPDDAPSHSYFLKFHGVVNSGDCSALETSKLILECQLFAKTLNEVLCELKIPVHTYITVGSNT